MAARARSPPKHSLAGYAPAPITTAHLAEVNNHRHARRRSRVKRVRGPQRGPQRSDVARVRPAAQLHNRKRERHCRSHRERGRRSRRVGARSVLNGEGAINELERLAGCRSSEQGL